MEHPRPGRMQLLGFWTPQCWRKSTYLQGRQFLRLPKKKINILIKEINSRLKRYTEFILIPQEHMWAFTWRQNLRSNMKNNRPTYLGHTRYAQSSSVWNLLPLVFLPLPRTVSRYTYNPELPCRKYLLVHPLQLQKDGVSNFPLKKEIFRNINYDYGIMEWAVSLSLRPLHSTETHTWNYFVRLGDLDLSGKYKTSSF